MVTMQREEAIAASVHSAPLKPLGLSPEDPLELADRWSVGKKRFMTATVIFMNFNVTLGSSLPSGASEVLNARFGVTSNLQTPLPVCLYLVGYVLGPIVFAPLSEFWGRRPVLLSSFALYTAFLLGGALVPSWPAFLFFRFLMGCGAAAPQTVSSGLFADIYSDPSSRGRAVTMLGLTSNVGPLIGPIISGYTSTLGWEWQNWIALILVGINWLMLILLPETFGPVVRKQQASRVKKEQGSETETKPQAEVRATLDTSFSWPLLTRPILILSEPIVLLSDAFILYQYIIFFLYFGSYPIIFQGTYQLSDGQSALMFLPTGVGALIAIFVYLAWDSYYTRALKAGKGWAQVEEYRRLPLACLGGPLFAISEFWLGWTARPDIHWIVPALSGIPLGIGIDLCFLALNNYLTDAYDVYSASALASSVFTRNLVAAVVIPFATYPLHDNLGTAWSCTLLGLLCVALVPIPFLFLKWGPTLRARSPFCQRMEELKRQRSALAHEHSRFASDQGEELSLA